MRNIIALLLGVVAVAALAEAASESNSSETGPYAFERLIWSDEFNTFDFNTWTHLVTAWDGGNREMQYYRNNRKNSFVRDGKLFIRPTATDEEMPQLERGRIEEANCNKYPCASVGDANDIVNPVFSARIMSRYRFSFKYGRVVVRAKMPSGDWIWPAVWMMPEEEIFGDWPRSGEIDIIEVRGNKDLKSPEGYNHGNNEVGSTLHFGPAWDNKAYLNRNRQAPAGKTWSDDFHIYEFVWTPDVMKFTVDGQIINEVKIPAGGFTQLGSFNHDVYRGKPKNTPFDQKFYFILNVAVGGEFFLPSWTSNGRPRPWSTWGDSKRQFWNSRGNWIKSWGPPDQHSLQVDYIRVYQ